MGGSLVDFPPDTRSFFPNISCLEKKRKQNYEILCFRFGCVKTTPGKTLQRLLSLLPSPKGSWRSPAPPAVPSSRWHLGNGCFWLQFSEGFLSSSSLLINFAVAWTARIHSPASSSPGGGGGQATVTVRIRGCWPGGTRCRSVRWGHCSFPSGSCSRAPGRSGGWAWGTGSRWGLCSG